MSPYHFFNLLSLERKDIKEVRVLKSHFNRLASQFNIHSHMLAGKHKEQIVKQLNGLQDQISSHK